MSVDGLLLCCEFIINRIAGSIGLAHAQWSKSVKSAALASSKLEPRDEK